MEEKTQTQVPHESKWEGKNCAEVHGLAAEEVWPLLADFCNFHKWFPNLDTCNHVEGIPGQPGLIRYCTIYSDAFTNSPSSAVHHDHQRPIKWAKEKLLTIDPIQRCFSYEIGENNSGFKWYVATMQVLPINGHDHPKNRSCKIEWSFVSDPVEGWTYEDFRSFLGSSLQSIAKKMEHALA